MSDGRTNRDGGYGWVIVAAFFMIEVVVDGVRFTFGLYFVEFLEEFEKGKGTTAWIGALMVATYNLCGPVFAFIVSKVGCRKASMMGGVITTIGYIMSCFAPNVYFLYLTYGVLPGFGFGLVFLSGTVMVGHYFLEKRSLAIGISFCGSGVGTFVITPLVAFLIDTYSWRGSVLIMAGLSFNCCAFSALYRPLKSEITEVDVTDSLSCAGNENGCPDKVEDSNCNGIHNSPLLKVNTANGTNGTSSGYSTTANGYLQGQATSPVIPRSFADSRKEHLQALETNDLKGSHHSLAVSHISRRSLNMSVLSQSILGSNASFGYMFDYRNKTKESTLTVNSAISITRSVRTLAEESGNVFGNSVIESMFPKALVTNTNFIILMISSFCIGVPSFIPFSMLPDYARSIGSSSSQCAWLLATIGIGGTISRVAAGWLSDMSCVHRLTLLGVCLLVLGVTTITAALVPIYEVLFTYSTAFGIFFGALYVVQPMVLLEYFGEEYIGEVMGVMMCVYGVALFIGSPLAGFGYGLIFLSGTVAVGRYFQEKRSLAIGISFCGSGVGSFIITPFVSYLIDTYTWRGSLVILAGISLNCCVLSSLYRPIEPSVDECEHTEVTESGRDNCSPIVKVKKGFNESGDAHTKTLSPLMPRTFADMRKDQLQALEKNDNNGSHRSLTLSHMSHRSLNMTVINQSILGSNASFGYIFDKRNKMKSSTSTVNAPLSFPKSDRTMAEESGNVFGNSVVESMFPKALVTNTNFIIMMISCVFIGLPSFIPFSMLPDYARSIGSSSSQSAWLLSIIGIGGTIGRVGSGYLSDLPCVHRLTLLGVCLLVLGITTSIVAFVPVYEILITFSTLFGMFFGAIYVVQPIVLLEYFGEDYIVEVMGVMMCVYGVSTILGSPMAGWIFDLTNSYTVSFLVAGISFLLSCVVNFGVLCTKPSRQARRLAKLERDLNTIDADMT